MSVIGDYIHLKLENYLEYGTNKYGQNKDNIINSYNVQKKRNDQRINNLKSINPKLLEELKSRMENNAYKKEARELVEAEYQFNNNKNDLEQQIKNAILTKVPEALEKYNKNGLISFSSNNFSMQENVIDDKKIEEAKKARKRILENINRINEQTEKGKSTSQKTLDTLNKNIETFFNNLGVVNNGLDYKVSNLNNLSMLDALKEIVQNISLTEATKAMFHGKYGEALYFTVADQIKVVGKNEVITNVKEALKTGEQTGEVKITTEMIPKSVGEIYQEKSKHNLYKLVKTQNKVDGSIQLNTEEGISDVLNASVKAYTPSGNIIKPHLQDVNLITNLIATEGQFANHWLNLHAHNISSIPMSVGKNQMDELLKQNIKYEALVYGNLLKRNITEADTFVVININKGEVKALSTKEMLASKTDNFIFDPLIESITIDNQRTTTWEERIANILMSLHEKKISVSYRVSFK